MIVLSVSRCTNGPRGRTGHGKRPGGSGQGVTVIDVEGAWQLGHEDLAAKLAGVVVGTPLADLAWRNHGTAVIGAGAAWSTRTR